MSDHEHNHHHHHHSHHHQPNTAPGGKDWGELGAFFELQAEVLAPLFQEALASMRSALRGLEVRRIVDLGCGPGVSVTTLGATFPEAEMIAIDQSKELLAMARARAARASMEKRLTTMTANLEDGLGSLAEVDLAWAGMVLHHLIEPPKIIREVAAALRPGGIFAFFEFGPLTQTLPETLGFGEDGFERRHQETMRAAVEAHLAPGALKTDWAAALSAAGLEVIEQRTLALHQEAPLPERSRLCVVREFARSAAVMKEKLSAQDQATLAILLDEQDPRSLMQRPDLSLRMGRSFFLARKSLSSL